MDDPAKIPLCVLGEGIVFMVRELCARADRGDKDAEGAALKLRAAFEEAEKLCRRSDESTECHGAAICWDAPADELLDGDEIEALSARAEKGDEAAERELLRGREALDASIERDLASGRVIEELVADLWRLATGENQEAKRALTNLREALEIGSRVHEPGRRRLREDQVLVMYEGLLVILRAAQGRSEYPRDVLRSIGEQTVELCKKLGFEPPDISFLKEGNE
jgi:hypothetical protein